MHLLLKRLYGSTSEKLDPQQGLLFGPRVGEAEAAGSAAAPPPATDAWSASSPTSRNRDRHGRGRIPDEIQREELVHDLTDAEKAALGGAENLVELPPERSEHLDWRPSTLFVVVHVRRKYARRQQLPESGLTLSEQNVAGAGKLEHFHEAVEAGATILLAASVFHFHIIDIPELKDYLRRRRVNLRQ
jgi:hypothetical protein